METSSCVLCNAFTFGYETTSITTADFWYYNVRQENTSPTTADSEVVTDLVADVLKGK